MGRRVLTLSSGVLEILLWAFRYTIGVVLMMLELLFAAVWTGACSVNIRKSSRHPGTPPHFTM